MINYIIIQLIVLGVYALIIVLLKSTLSDYAVQIITRVGVYYAYFVGIEGLIYIIYLLMPSRSKTNTKNQIQKQDKSYNTAILSSISTKKVDTTKDKE